MGKAGRAKARPSKFMVLDVLRDLLLGGRHSRQTLARCGVSLPTADRWLKALVENVPGVRRVRQGKTTWYEYRAPSSTATSNRGTSP